MRRKDSQVYSGSTKCLNICGFSCNCFIVRQGVGIWLSYREMLGSSTSGHQFCSLWRGNKITSCEDMVTLIWWLIETVIFHTFAFLIRSSECQIQSDPIHRSVLDPL
jgi:hypothetical protein